MKKENLKRKLRIMRRKKWPIALVAILIVAIVAVPIVSSAISMKKRLEPKTPLPLSDVLTQERDRARITLIAHRGYSAQAPENTLPAIKKAAEYARANFGL